MIKEYQENWEQFNALQISYFSKSKSPSCFELLLSPILSVLDISAVQEILHFFAPKSTSKQQNLSKKQEEKAKTQNLNIEKLTNLMIKAWIDDPPLKIIIKVKPSRLYIRSLPCESNESKLTSDIMVYVDHQGISFSNENSYPSLEQIEDNPTRFFHNRYALKISNLMAGLAIRNRTQSFKKDKFRVSYHFFNFFLCVFIFILSHLSLF